MARPSKCRICGYRFKGNEDICPDCFTARDDDISCEQFSGEDHSHGQGFSTTHESDIYDEFHESSFIDEQKREESNDPIPNATYGGKFGNPPPTYAQQSYQNTQQTFNRTQSNTFRYNNNNLNGADRLERLNAIKNGTFVPQNPNMASRQGFNTNGQFYTRSALQQRKKSNGIVAVVVIIFIISFCMPVIIGVIAATNGVESNKNNKRPLESFSYQMSKPDVSIPDFRSVKYTGDGYTLTANKIYLFKPFDLNEVKKQWGEDALSEYTPFDEKYKDKARFMSFVLSIETDNNGYEVLWNDTTVEAYSILKGSLALSQLTLIENSEDDKRSLYFYTSDDITDFKIHVPVKNKATGEETICNLTVSSIHIIKSNESYGTEELDALFENSDLSADASADKENDN